MKRSIEFLLFFSSLVALFGCSNDFHEPALTNISVSPTIKMTFFSLEKTEALYLYHNGKLVLDYSEPRLSDEADTSFEVCILHEKMFFPYDRFDNILVIGLLNVSSNERQGLFTYLFFDLKRDQLVAKVKGRELYHEKMADSNYVFGVASSDSFTDGRGNRVCPDVKVTYLGSNARLNLPNITIDPKALELGAYVWDYDGDGHISVMDGRRVILNGDKLSPKQLAVLDKNFDSQTGTLILPNDKDFSLLTSPALCRYFEENYVCTSEKAVNLVSQWDADNNFVINWADDINLDGQLNEADFLCESHLFSYLNSRYSSSFTQSDLCLNDVLFGLNAVNGNFQDKISKASPLNMGFKPFERKVSASSTIKYNFTKTKDDSKTGTLLGSGLGATLGFVCFNVPGMIVGSLIGAGTGNAIGGKRHRSHDERTMEYFQYEREKVAAVNVAVFTAANNYKVFILDAAPSVGIREMRTIVERYEDGTLSPVSKNEIRSTWELNYDQNTTGRISVYDPDRKLQCNFTRGVFSGLFDQRLYNVEADARKVEILKQPFETALKEVTEGQLWQLNQIAMNLKNFKGEENISNQNLVLDLKLNPSRQ